MVSVSSTSKVYKEWKGKVVSSKKAWRLKDVIVYPIEGVKDKKFTALCPLGAFRILWGISKNRK